MYAYVGGDAVNNTDPTGLCGNGRTQESCLNGSDGGGTGDNIIATAYKVYSSNRGITRIFRGIVGVANIGGSGRRILPNLSSPETKCVPYDPAQFTDKSFDTPNPDLKRFLPWEKEYFGPFPTIDETIQGARFRLSTASDHRGSIAIGIFSNESGFWQSGKPVSLISAKGAKGLKGRRSWKHHTNVVTTKTNGSYITNTSKTVTLKLSGDGTLEEMATCGY